MKRGFLTWATHLGKTKIDFPPKTAMHFGMHLFSHVTFISSLICHVFTKCLDLQRNSEWGGQGRQTVRAWYLFLELEFPFVFRPWTKYVCFFTFLQIWHLKIICTLVINDNFMLFISLILCSFFLNIYIKKSCYTPFKMSRTFHLL